MQSLCCRSLAIFLAAAMIHAAWVEAAAPVGASTSTAVAVSTPTLQITPHTYKKNDSKWNWKDWLIVIAGAITLGAVAAVGAGHRSSGSGSGGMNSM
jgi:hypothetical protein